MQPASLCMFCHSACTGTYCFYIVVVTVLTPFNIVWHIFPSCKTLWPSILKFPEMGPSLLTWPTPGLMLLFSFLDYFLGLNLPEMRLWGHRVRPLDAFGAGRCHFIVQTLDTGITIWIVMTLVTFISLTTVRRDIFPSLYNVYAHSYEFLLIIILWRHGGQERRVLVPGHVAYERQSWV